MNINRYYLEKNIPGVSGLFYASGSFKEVNKTDNYKIEYDEKCVRYSLDINGVTLCAKFTEEENGVIIRRDSLKNNTKESITLNAFFSRFYLGGGDFEVYTQYNGWLNESNGSWQNLTTCVTAQSMGMRSCDGATPMMALHNKSNGKITVFHILPNAQWKISAYKKPVTNKELIIVEAGFNDSGLNMTVNAEEEIFLPETIFFNAENKIDLDAFKLHSVYNRLYPRKTLPVGYNSWLYCFGILNIDDLINQAKKASEMGFEAFLVDAGWFGKGENWSLNMGDWYENDNLEGRLTELSNLVKNHGMIFGLWFEPERAGANCQSKKERPEYYIDNYFFDFSKDGAAEFMADKICPVIEKYGIGWVKFDFNDTLPDDPEHSAYYRYHKGQKRFIDIIKKKFPEIYITNCASGGYRADLYQGSYTDSLWPSDNESIIDELRIIKDSYKRLPCALIERVNVQKYCDGIPIMSSTQKKGVMLNCNDATWDSVVSVNSSYTDAILKSGPIVFSCDICDFPTEITKHYKSLINEYKKEREFFKNATVRILADDKDFTAFQYSDENFKKIVIQLFINRNRFYDLRIFPKINEKQSYDFNGKTITGKKLAEEGIVFTDLTDYSCQEINLTML